VADIKDALADAFYAYTRRAPNSGLREAFEKYADHLGTCRTNHSEHHPLCDCGYAETVAALRGAPQRSGEVKP